MGAIDIPFLFDLESRLRVIQENEFTRVAANENMWWSDITKVQMSGSKKELFFWILSTATIEPQGYGGNIQYDDMVVLESDYTNLDSGKGFKVRKNQFDDLDGNGVRLASEWVSQQSALAAYWPQQQVASLIANGESGICYDGSAYFSGSHPYNPYDTGVGSYSNIFTGEDDGIYPGAVPIDESVTLDEAFKNISKVIAYIKSLKMPNGKTPRFLVPKFLIAPPALQTRAVLLTGAKEIALAASTPGGSNAGAGSVNVEGVVKKWGLNEPIVADELGSSITGNEDDDTSYYVGCEQMTSSQLGALLYVDREPFKITYYTGDGGGNGVDAILDRSRELEWHQHGRNVAGYGHPYALFKCKAA